MVLDSGVTAVKKTDCCRGKVPFQRQTDTKHSSNFREPSSEAESQRSGGREGALGGKAGLSEGLTTRPE